MKISMNYLISLSLMVPASQSAFAREVKFDKKVDPAALQMQLINAGFKISYIECSVSRCKITMPDSEKKDPIPEIRKYVHVDSLEARERKLVAMRALYEKWEAGTILNEEKDQLIRSSIGLVLGR